MLTGYADRLSAAPGEEVAFHVSAAPRPYSLRLVRLHGPRTPQDATATVHREDVPNPADGEYDGREQVLRPGSYAHVEVVRPLALQQLTVDLWVLPTLPDEERQVLLSGTPPSVEQRGTSASRPGPTGSDPGWAVVLQGKELRFELRSGQHVGCLLPEASPQWLHVVASFDPASGRASLRVRGTARWEQDRVAVDVAGDLPPLDGPVLISEITMAAELLAGVAGGFFTGRLESPRLLEARPGATLEGVAPLAHWDFSRDVAADVVRDVGGLGLDARLYNRPTRAVLGHTWDRRTMDFSLAPSQWGAIHFHRDDLGDAGWDADVTVTLPSDLPSGIYAAHLEQDGESDDIPFYVTGAPGSASRVLFLAPTNTYLAYANEHLAHGERGPAHETMMAAPIVLADADVFLRDHPELGLSLYDTHVDGSGSAYSSWRRPILNFRPDYVTWLTAGRRHLAADFYITGWLDHVGEPYDVATDEDLDRLGDELLAGYDVVITGSHPEYVTEGEYDAIEHFAATGGKVMYLGANGFFWVTSFTGPDRTAIECRRGVAAQRNWTSHPAEVHHSSTGELGGAWLHRGRSSREVFGVGMCAAGWGPASPYTRTEQSRHPDVASLFDGIEGDLVGASGLVLGGAAGDELDSADFRAGTPRHAKVLLTSRHGDKYLPTLEAVQSIAPLSAGTHNPEVRADVVLLATAEGGEVFSVGSICWAGSLAADSYASSVARLTTAVLRRFLGDRAG